MCKLKQARRIHRLINKRCFNGQLPAIKFKFWHDSADSAHFQGEYENWLGTKNKSFIAINALHNKTFSVLFDTVAHETCHQYQHITQGYELGHGGDFIDMMLDIETEFNTELRVIYDT